MTKFGMKFSDFGMKFDNFEMKFDNFEMKFDNFDDNFAMKFDNFLNQLEMKFDNLIETKFDNLIEMKFDNFWMGCDDIDVTFGELLVIFSSFRVKSEIIGNEIRRFGGEFNSGCSYFDKEIR